MTIHKEGSISKFVDRVASVSFSAKRAIANGQKVLYVTERCVFRLTPKGLKLVEVYPGIDMEKGYSGPAAFLRWKNNRAGEGLLFLIKSLYHKSAWSGDFSLPSGKTGLSQETY